MNCKKCETEVTEVVANYSKDKYDGQVYCFDCQKAQPKVTTWKPKANGNGKSFGGSKTWSPKPMDPTTMLTSYAKDSFIAMMNKIENPKNEDVAGLLWQRANEDVWKSYQFFKEKLK